MSWKTILLLAGLLILAAVILFAVNLRRLDRQNRRLAAELLADARQIEQPSQDEIARLPATVAKYLEGSLSGGSFPATARFEQTGEMLQGGAWREFEAVQHVTAEPAGFVWAAQLAFAPLVGVRVVDMYREGQGGALQAKLLGTFTVADAAPAVELDVGELARFLAEGPWLPTVLVPRDDLKWSEVDASSARATLASGEHTVSLLFHFNERGDVVRVEGERPRSLEDGSYATGYWVGTFSGHREVDGVRIPTEGEVGWLEGDVLEPYWRGRVERVEFDPLPERY